MSQSNVEDRPVGIIGLGTMGSGMARALLAHGWPVHGFDLAADRVAALEPAGLEPAKGLAELAETVDVLLVSVVRGEQLEKIAGDLAAVRAGLLLIDTSTVDPNVAAGAAATLEQAGSSVLRAPVSGSEEMAKAGALKVFCSGEKADYERAVPILDTIAGERTWVGAGERARVAKLAINLVVSGIAALLGDALALAEANGLSRKDTLTSLQASVAGSPYINYKAPALAVRDYTPTATLDLAVKDVGLILDLAEASELELPVTIEVGGLYRRAADAGWGDRDHSIVAEVMRPDDAAKA